jgi:peptidyl-prolyl cis-trans isomerase A (cyclophilin A)/peptidyl-prolyl cis-trans isomerase B (cyclophilin B)
VDNRQEEAVTNNIVQSRAFTYPMQPKPTMRPIICESRKGMLNKKGTIAMARGAAPDSATSQFFFNVENNPSLDYMEIADKWDPQKIETKEGYCAFGRVLRGMKVVEQMLNVKTRKQGMMDDVPVTPIYITKAYRAK